MTSTMVRGSEVIRRTIESQAVAPPESAEVSRGSTGPFEPDDHHMQPDAFTEDEVVTHRLEDLPKELGVLLASVGVLGVVLPGVAGAPALIAGGLVLWPKTFSRVEDWFHDRFPIAHRKSMEQVGRFLDDLDRRYPMKDKSGS